MSKDLCRLEFGVPVISNECRFNSSNITDLTDVSEVDGKESSTKKQLKKKSKERKTWHLR